MHCTSNSELKEIYFIQGFKEFIWDLKPGYKATSEEAALYALDAIDEKWGKKYANAVKS